MKNCHAMSFVRFGRFFLFFLFFLSFPPFFLGGNDLHERFATNGKRPKRRRGGRRSAPRRVASLWKREGREKKRKAGRGTQD
ncbi:MAG: hypothetical protein ACTS4U_00250 [Candidatus Hodgkinia cicadicola]